MLIADFTFSLIITGANMQSLIISISAHAQADFPSFEVDDILGPYESTSQVTNNVSDTSGNFSIDIETDDCEMTPCPPGHACIQSCP